MQRMTAIKHEEAEGKQKELLDAVKAKFGFVPNMMATMAASPAVLEAYLNFSNALGSSLNAKLREQIALATAEINHCRYCASAHTAIGKMVGLDDEAVTDARRAAASDERADAALKFAQALLIGRGQVTDAQIEAVRAAGYADAEIAEIVANTVLNILTNYFNETAKTTVDFPAVDFPLTIRAANA